MTKNGKIECVCIPRVIIDAIRCTEDPYDPCAKGWLWVILNYAEYGTEPEEKDWDAFFEGAKELIDEVNKDAPED